MKIQKLRRTRNLILALLLQVVPLTPAQPFVPGDVSPNFTLPNFESGKKVNLTDFEGSVIVLDFFAYWCAPCSVSSPDLERNIQKYYEERGGNAHGVPVQVISMNLEEQVPENTRAFIRKADLDFVVNDFKTEAWNLYNLLGLRPSIPLFVIINGVAGSPNHKQWEVLHSQHGMYILPNQTTAKLFRGFIDQIEPGLRFEERGPNPFGSVPDDGRGWKTSNWFGKINDAYFPWIFHTDLSWQYVARRSTASNFYFHDPGMGWMFTSNELYPKVYSFSRAGWLFLNPAISGTGQFFDYNTKTWIAYGAAVPPNPSEPAIAGSSAPGAENSPNPAKQ